MNSSTLSSCLAAAAFVCVASSANAQGQLDSAHAKEREFTNLASFFASLPAVQPQQLDPKSALALSAMPFSCEDHPQPPPVAVPYLWEVNYTPVDSFETRRAFYGCYDWHSSVNSAWTLVKLLKAYPDMPTARAIRHVLNDHFGASNIASELEFSKTAGTFEVPYGYAWLLRLQGELKSWNDADAVRWAKNIQPLATYMSERMIVYFNGLKQPVRTGVHPNTAMAINNSLLYATHFDPPLEAAIRQNATRLFGRDIRCNTAVEPGPSDFASPCLMEASIMGQLMERAAYLKWLDRFLPPLQSVAFRPLTKTLGLEFVENASVASKSHIVGLSLVRATSMTEIANHLPESDPRVPVLRRLATIQAAKGLSEMGAVGYDGSHYYATWATTYLMAMAEAEPKRD